MSLGSASKNYKNCQKFEETGIGLKMQVLLSFV